MDTRERHIFWSPDNAIGLEHLALTVADNAISANSLVIGEEDGAPFRLHYAVACDGAWRVRSAVVQLAYPSVRALHFVADGVGRWSSSDGTVLPTLDGCVDIDISATPWTNTLPIQRLALQPGTAAEIRVVYFDVPALTYAPQRQRYTCLAPERYRYEGLDTGYTNEITVDADGLVVDYPGLFRRIQN